MDQKVYQNCVAILKEELVPALGCTEPIAVAYAAARAREALGCFPERMAAECSGNIIKNVKGVIVPTTGDLRGIRAAAVLGAVGGAPDRELEVLSTVKPSDVEEVRRLLAQGLCEEKLLDTPAKLHIIIRMWAGEHSSMVEIIHAHANVVRVEKDGAALVDVPHTEEEAEGEGADRSCLTIASILQFADEVKIEDVKELLDHQIACNMAIAQEGLTNPYGANVGKNLLELYGDERVEVKAKAWAAAGSDARMSGCDLAVVANSGSGNQGITVSVPVVQYARALNVPEDKLYRALCISNLMAAHLKSGIGRLSAFCGAVSAGTGAGAAIVYLQGGTRAQIEQTITNTLGNVAGIVCDGAKPSCGAKIAAALDAAILGGKMAFRGDGFQGGEGILSGNIEDTIRNVGRLGRKGMHETDIEILNMMIGR